MDDYFARFSLHMNYGEIGGKTEPPITSLTVFTVVPLAARGCSQLSRAVKSAAVMEYTLQLLQTWWKINCTQPPPDCSVCVIQLSMVARLVLLLTSVMALVAYGLRGGMVSGPMETVRPLL